MSRHSLPLLALICAVLAILSVAPARAAPATPGTPIVVDSLVEEVQACGRVVAFCRGRFYGGPPFRHCVQTRGCFVPGPHPVPGPVAYCRQQFRICAENWYPGSPPFRRCMVRRGC